MFHCHWRTKALELTKHSTRAVWHKFSVVECWPTSAPGCQTAFSHDNSHHVMSTMGSCGH
jgi:hypothetical protein